QLTEIGASMGEAQIAVLVDIVTAALQRNYPEMTPGKVENLIDLGNASALLTPALTGPGLKHGITAVGEAAAPGIGSGVVSTSPGSPSDAISGAVIIGEKSTVCLPPPAGIAT